MKRPTFEELLGSVREAGSDFARRAEAFAADCNRLFFRARQPCHPARLFATRGSKLMRRREPLA